jgi:hypothetical protein
MNRIASEIAQEVGMRLQHDDRQAGPCQQKTKHYSRRTTARYRAAR